MSFTHLHVHTEYSLLDSITKIKDLVKQIKALNMDACAITDHGVGYGLVEFYNECKKAGIKPILGCEMYEAPSDRFLKEEEDNEKYYHLILLVKNETGYKNLCKLITRGNTEGFYVKPRIDIALLKEFHEGLICTSACVAGRIATDILKGDLGKAEEDILMYKDIFGDDFYLEVQNHGLKDEQMVAYEIAKLSKKLGVKVICTNDSHYVYSEDKEAHDWALCIGYKKTVNDENRIKYEGDYSIKSEEDMRKLFPAFPEYFDNTEEIKDKCNFDFTFGNYRMPKVVIPDSYGTDYFRYLKDEAYKGLDIRYPVGHNERELAKERLAYELDVVEQMGFAEYFLDTRKTILWSRNNGILVGPGRGSAAGSVMCYCLSITDIDPLRYGLLFERFLNPERISMPDIDVDYQYDRKEDVVRSEAESNGYSNFCKIQTFMGMLAKGVLKDCARVAGYEPAIGTKLSSFIPNEIGITLESAFDNNPELREFVESDADIEKLWNIALKLEGVKRTTSVHACGHIPTPVPCEDLFPCSVDKESGYLVSQYNMVEAEHLGNLKKDLLMLRNLTIISAAMAEVKRTKNISVNLWTDEILNDKKALELFSTGQTNGVFQFESPGMKKFIKDLKPNCFEDVIAAVSLYRPGPMEYIPDYIKGKHNPETVRYLTPKLEPILKNTYGVIVYQEQVMQIVRELADFSMGRADVVRKAMGKKKMDIMEEEGKNFIYGNPSLSINGCINNGISEEIAQTIYAQMTDFAKYAFNKSHAACYAAIAMQTAYLKAHYPVEYYTGLLTSVEGSASKLNMYINECKDNGINILPPDVNKSSLHFTMEDDNSIRFGLLSLKGIGEDVINALIEERKREEYLSLTDFIKRTSSGKGVLEPLIKSGAFDFTGFSRKAMMISYPTLNTSLAKEAKKNVAGQLNIFDLMDDGIKSTDDTFTDCPEYTMGLKIAYEKEVTGTYISGHPLDEYLAITNMMRYHANDLQMPDDETISPNVKDGEMVSIFGIITEVRKKFTKKGDAMAFITIEDKTGSVSVTVFPKVYKQYTDKIMEDRIVKISGSVNIDSEYGISVLADTILYPDEINSTIWIQFDTKADYEREMAYVLSKSENATGKMLICYIRDTKEKLCYKNYCKASPTILNELENHFGKDNVKVTYNASMGQ